MNILKPLEIPSELVNVGLEQVLMIVNATLVS